MKRDQSDTPSDYAGKNPRCAEGCPEGMYCDFDECPGRKKRAPVSERGTLSAVKQFVRGWMHECPTDTPTVKRLCELNALFERNSDG